MSETVEVNGLELNVRRADNLPFPYNLSATIVASRMEAKQQSGDTSGIEDDFADLAALCIEDDVQPETFKQLDPKEMAPILGAMFPHMENADE